MASVSTTQNYAGRMATLTVVESYDINTNISTITWTLEVKGGSVNYYNAYEVAAYVNGQTVYGPTTKTWDTKTFPAAKGTKTGTISIVHRDDGTADPVPFAIRGSFYNNNPKTVNGTPLPLTTRYSVAYAANGGNSTPATQYKLAGNSVTLSGAISRNSTTVNGYVINFNANGGSVSPTSRTATDTTSYSFSKWRASNGTDYSASGIYSADTNTTMTAQWSSSTSKGAITTPSASRSNTTSTRTVTFNANGGSCLTGSLNSNATVTYSGNGWYTASSGGTKRCANGGSYTPGTGENLYQQWSSSTSSYSSISFPNATKSNTSTKRTVTFNATGNGGSSSTSTLTSTATVSYSLSGWFTSSSGGTKRGTYGGSYTPSGSETLYAQFSSSTGTYSQITLPNASKTNSTATRTVTFNANGGTCNTTSLNSNATVTYSLSGWYTAASGGTKRGTYNGKYTPSGNETLYAQFTATTGAFSYITLPTATRNGYAFKGWNVNSSAATGTTGSYQPSETQILYAIWEEDQPSSVQLNILNVGHTKIRFSCSCEHVTNPIFTLYYTAEGGNEQTYVLSGSGSSRTAILTGLRPGTTYTLYMKAQNSIQTQSSTSTATTQVTLANIPTNLNLNVTNIQYSTADITVSATGGTNAPVTNYTLYWRKKPSKPTYDMAVKSLSDGSYWARIFYHDNIEGTNLFTTVEECRNVQTATKYSRLYLLDNDENYNNIYKGADGNFEFMLCYPNNGLQYNRWKQRYSPCDIYTGTGQGSFVPGYEASHTDWSSNNWGGLERNSADETQIQYTYLDGSVGFGNWWYAIGAISVYEEIGIPGPGKTITGPVELWVRIDSGTINSLDLGTNTVAHIEGLEDWTKYVFYFSSTDKGGTNWSSAVDVETYKNKAANIMIKNGWQYDEYKKLDYLQSTAEQWIDSGINPSLYNSHLIIDADVQFTQTTGHEGRTWQTIIGAAQGDVDGTWYWHPQFHIAVNGDNKIVVEYPMSEDPTTTDHNSIVADDIAGLTRHRVTVIIDENIQSLKVDGLIKEKTSHAFGGPDCNLYIFSKNYVEIGEFTKIDYAANLKLYHLTISTSDGIVLRDFFPCERKSDNKPGLYDIITNTFYPNESGESDFISGNTEIWNKGHLLYKQDGAWKRVEKLYIKQNNHWKKVE